MQNLEAFKTLINTQGLRIIITTHHKPDADALGSSLGLAEYLVKKGHEVKVITPTDYPFFLTWMHGNDDVLVYNMGHEQEAERLINEADLIFCLDFSGLHRINELGELVRHSNAKKVLIDHHLEPEDFADFTLWSTEAAATAELVFQLLVDLGDQELIDKNIAECLYAGIMTDTGSFKHPNTTFNVFRVCAELIALGADTSKVARLIYDTNSIDRVKFLGFALNDRLTILPEYNTAYFAISSEDLKKFNSKTGDTEGLVNYALSIDGIKFAALMVDRTEAIKISFRSVGEFSVRDFANNYFEGGGHRNAAGGKSDLTLEETVEKFEKLIEEHKEELNTKNKIYA
ncbi:MAG: bifunctional oligoribonuclease/PAP phosphatase NrnA [Bacteroidota bacterium]